MDLQDLISRLALAFGIGLLIGLERGWRRRKGTAGSRAAGIRTFTIAGLLGGGGRGRDRRGAGDARADP